MKVASFAGFEDHAKVLPMLAWESTEDGWRALTPDGEVLNVQATSKPNGHDVYVKSGGVVSKARLPAETPGRISDYLTHYDRSGVLFRENRFEEALSEIRNAGSIAETACVRYQRSLILLSLGRWSEGFDDLQWCEEHSHLFMRPMQRAAFEHGLVPWRGQSLKGRRLLLLGDHGLGDTIMVMRYIPYLMELGADVAVLAPELAWAFPTVAVDHVVDADFFCSFLLLLGYLEDNPADISPMSYIYTPRLKDPWKDRLGPATRPRFGLAWSVGREHEGDYPRSMPLEQLVDMLPGDAELHSVQKQGADEAREHNVTPHDFKDLGECATFMTHMDFIVSVDTCALHLAGAIGHPHVVGLLSKWHSWRWKAQWYANMNLQVILP